MSVKKLKENMWFVKAFIGMILAILVVFLFCDTVVSAEMLVDTTDCEINNDKSRAVIVMETTQEDLEAEFYYDSLEMMALCVMAEAGGEDEFGIRLVADTILNRVDSEEFPDSIWDVIFQPGAFTCVSNGMIEKVNPTENIFQIITEELENRTDYRPLYFTAGEYPKYGTPLYKVGNHYFAGWKEVQDEY